MRLDGIVEDVDGDFPPQDGRVVGDDDDDDFPLREGTSPGGIAPSRAKVLLPKFHLETVALRPKSPLFIFFLGKMTYIPEEGHRRWAEKGTPHRGAFGPPAPPGWVVTTWWAPSGSYLLQYFLNNP